MTLADEARTDILSRCTLFAGVAPEGLEILARRATEIDFPANHVIARQGDIGTGLFLIVSGRVRVVRDGRVLAARWAVSRTLPQSHDPRCELGHGWRLEQCPQRQLHLKNRPHP